MSQMELIVAPYWGDFLPHVGVGIPLCMKEQESAE